MIAIFSLNSFALDEKKTWEDALELYDRNNRSPTLELLMELANEGDLKSQISLGTGKIDEFYLPISKNDSFKWLEKAALQNDVNSQYLVAKLYMSKTDDIELFVFRDRILKWLSNSANQGNEEAKIALNALKPLFLNKPAYNSKSALVEVDGFNQFYNYVSDQTCSCRNIKIQCISELEVYKDECFLKVQKLGLKNTSTHSDVQKVSAVVGKCINDLYINEIKKSRSPSQTLCIYTKNHSKI